MNPTIGPTAYGASADDRFDLVIPSLPGYGFSAKPTETGWDPVQTAQAWVELMKRLGFSVSGNWLRVLTDWTLNAIISPEPTSLAVISAESVPLNVNQPQP